MKNKIILIIIILLLAGGAGYYIYNDLSPTRRVGESEEPQQPVVEIPNLDRPINITVNLTKEAEEIIRKKIEELSSKLKENPNLLDLWLDLGIYRKIIGDYEGAVEAWEYVSVVSPKNSTSFHNLGDLYAFYLKDYQKAEKNFLIAIENNPSQIFSYRSLYELYRYAMKDDEKAKEILKKGIEINPDTSQDLKNLLDRF
ncbi:MAG: hypothetical protein AB1643_00085 [Patescibacteria group bacterium]